MRRAIVTGGGGFLGSWIARELVARGVETTSLSRAPHPELEALGVRHVQADLRDADALREAFRGHDTVFHAAAKAGVWGPSEEYGSINVDGTRNALEAARAAGALRFVHTSSPSVVFDGSDHVEAGPELPYPESFLAAYPRTKAEAERLALAANDTPSGDCRLATCALRPHLIFGPGDPHLVPRLVDRARAGRLAVVGSRDNQVSLTYVENAALAHVEAALRLAPDAPHAGRAYFVNQREPVRLWDWIDGLLDALSIPRPTKRVSPRVAYGAGALLEGVWRVLRLSGEPPMTRFVARQLATSHTYDLGPAERDFGYVERVSLEQANEATRAWARGLVA